MSQSFGSLTGEAGKSWTAGELDVVIEAYFALLAAELRGERPVKADVVRELQRHLPARTRGSIERKMQNISAILDQGQRVWIEGYKPLSHYQSDLERAVHAWIGRERRISEHLAEYQASVLPAPRPSPLAIEDVLVPPPSVVRRGSRQRSIGLTTGRLGAIQDFRNRRLGKAGEEWVLDAERLSLKRAGRDDLADRVSWTAHEVGDGAGFDIASFRIDGSPLAIEVKTTNLGPRTPFYITRWEVETSRKRPDSWALYRVFDFRSDPRLYKLEGSVDRTASLEPYVFVGLPR
jgi:hypothetical protein